MKNLFLLFIAMVLLQPAFAQTSDKKWGIGAGLGAYGTLNEDGVGLMPELYLSRYLSPRLDLMLKGDLGLFNSALTNDLDLANAFLNLRYKLSDENKKFRPYLFAGPGFLKDNMETGLNFDLGVGGKYYFNPNTALYVDAGYINGIEVTEAAKQVRDNLWKVTAGIEFDFGKTLDSDMDGVSDKKDKCPNTPTGVAVDEKGCPVDSDGDGVADYIDDCPTIPGLTSLKGCPDTDNDGVADKDDKCPETPKGWKVDATGCPLDQDKDGVSDSEDDCPTVAGPKNNKGCPVKEVEKKNDQVEEQSIIIEPVLFDSGKSALTTTSKGTLDKLVKTLQANTSVNLNISGFADSQGPEDLNYKLSQNRVESVVNYLTNKGISPEKIVKQQAFGENKPVATNDTPEGRQQNRRVEFDIFKTK